MARNEKTSKRVAKVAGRVLAMNVGLRDGVFVADRNRTDLTVIKWSDIRALAASALTQTADKKPKPFTSRAEVRKAVRKLRPYTVDAASIPELDAGFGPKPRRKVKRKAA